MRKINLYQFEELSEYVKQKAIDNFKNEFEIDEGTLTEIFKKRLIENGYAPENIYWSLSYCQGDGVVFTGTITEKLVERYIDYCGYKHDKKRIKNIIDSIDISISHYGDCYHYNSMNIDYYFPCKDCDIYTHIDKVIDDFVEWVKDDIKCISKELENIGYSEIEYRLSDEYISEFLIANEYEFFENGELYC